MSNIFNNCQTSKDESDFHRKNTILRKATLIENSKPFKFDPSYPEKVTLYKISLICQFQKKNSKYLFFAQKVGQIIKKLSKKDDQNIEFVKSDTDQYDQANFELFRWEDAAVHQEFLV
jgi:hypothetical protein